MNSKTTSKPDLEYYMGKLEPQYESTGQAKIGRMLDEYGIPFFYKQPLLVWEYGQCKIQRPDFTLPTYNNTVVEYISRRNYATGLRNSVYKQNNITALFIDDFGLSEPNWQQRLYDKLEEICHQPMLYLTNRYSEDRR